MNGKWFGSKKAGVGEGGVGSGGMLSNSTVPDNFTRVCNVR